MVSAYKLLSTLALIASYLLGFSSAKVSKCQIVPDWQKSSIKLDHSRLIRHDSQTNWTQQFDDLGVYVVVTIKKDGSYLVHVQQFNGGKTHYMITIKNKGESNINYIRINGGDICQNTGYRGEPEILSLAVVV